MARSDDDALTWDGDDDPTLDTGAPPASSTTEPASEAGESAPVDTTEAGSAGTKGTDAEPVGLPSGYTPLGKGSDEVGSVHADGTVTMPGERKPMGTATLITLGVLAGFYLIFTIGWIIGGLRLQDTLLDPLADIMFQGSFWLAVLAPALWFGTVFLLTRRSAGWVRVVWLVAGAILLVPWPFIMVGAVGL